MTGLSLKLWESASMERYLQCPGCYLLITCSLIEVTIQLEGSLKTRVACAENASQN